MQLAACTLDLISSCGILTFKEKWRIFFIHCRFVDDKIWEFWFHIRNQGAQMSDETFMINKIDFSVMGVELTFLQQGKIFHFIF